MKDSVKTTHGITVAIALLAVYLCLGGGAARVMACGDILAPMARQALSEDPVQSQAACQALRAAGPVGLNTLMEVYRDEIQGRAEATGEKDTAISDERWEKLRAVLDSVSRQRNAFASGLYWYTDWETAKSTARDQNKPILSLRLLGNLDDEFSCANSRFFRTVLYANTEVSTHLRENFVLHWQSVRPVPRVTINFGDGRKLERTLTGNSIHYVLDAKGRLVDALPGLYGPKAFLRSLRTAARMVQRGEGLDGDAFQSALRGFHGARIQAVKAAWAADLTAIGRPPVPVPVEGGIPIVLASESDNGSAGGPPPAMEAELVTTGKMLVEAPMLRAMGYGADSLRNSTDDESWKRIAELHRADARLDQSSVGLMCHQNPAANGYAEVGPSQVRAETFARTVREFERSIAEDTVRNEYQLHLRIHEWLANEKSPSGVMVFNERVYAELFLTPSTDPWLGLAPAQTYTALVNNGVTQNGAWAVANGRYPNSGRRN